MNWATILPAIAALLASLTGLDVRDGGMPAEFTDPVLKAKLEFRITSCNGIGEDEWRYAYDSNADAIRLTICGSRRFALSVRCEGYDQQAGQAAAFYLERIYTCLSLPTVIDYLDAIGVAWIDAGPYVDLPRTKDDRIFSIGSKDFIFTGAVNQSADGLGAGLLPAASPIPFIQSVELVSRYLYEPDGTTQTVPQIDLTVTI